MQRPSIRPIHPVSTLRLALFSLLAAAWLFPSACASETDQEGTSAKEGVEGWLDVLEGETFDLEAPLEEPWQAAAEALLGTAPSRATSALRVVAPLPSPRPDLVIPLPDEPAEPEPGDDLEPPPWAMPEEGWPFVPGELIVRLATTDEAPAELAAERIDLLHDHPGLEEFRFEPGTYAGPDLLSVKIYSANDPERSLDFDETLEVAERLADHPGLRYAHPNYLRRIHSAPDDPYYPAQWHLHQLHMEAAWEITTGSSDVVVAVVDTGVKAHDDLDAERLLPGYDMVSHPMLAGDGDGRDPDPSPVRGRSWHGQHVAGTIAATADNGIGVTGVDWSCKILPIRGIGQTGWGLSIDIIAGIRWASGGSVPGLPENPHPAQIINLSLGGGPLVEAEEEAIHEAVRSGSLVVAAAGNDGADASGRSYAGYLNVLTVGAVDQSGNRAPYSNFGRTVDLMAPGGNLRRDVDGDGNPDGVLSLYFDRRGTRSLYSFLEGTSMAAPHVSGIAALVKAVAPELGPVELKHLLVRTASSQSQCTEGCGSGLVNPLKALLEIANAADAKPRLAVSLQRLDLGRRHEGKVFVTNTGGGNLSWSATVTGPHAQYLQLSTTSGKLGAGDSAALEVRAEPDGLPDGEYEATLRIEGANARREVVVSFTVRETLPDVGEVVVGLVSFDADRRPVVGASITTRAEEDYAYRLPALEGSWHVLAVADTNRDGAVGEGDWLGVWRSWDAPEELRPAESPTDFIDFPLRRYRPDALLPSGKLGDACSEGPACNPPLYCDSSVSGGFCTAQCSSQSECPGGICALVSDTAAFCFAPCQPSKGCANPETECVSAGGDTYVCFPKL